MLSSCHPPHTDTPTHSQHTSGRTVCTPAEAHQHAHAHTHTMHAHTLAPCTGVAKTGGSQAMSSPWSGGVESEAGDSVPRPKREGWKGRVSVCPSTSC